MKGIKSFEEFVKEKIVKTQKPDKSRSAFLIVESEKSYEFLKEVIDKVGINNDNANNYVKSCYDILMELIRAKMLLEGYNASGQGAHEAEVSYVRILGVTEKDVQFIDQIRYFRNGMLYYGTILDKEYAQKVVEFTLNIYPKLKEKTKVSK